MGSVICIRDSANGSKVQMVASHGEVGAMFAVIPEVTQHSQRSLGAPGGHSANPEVNQACSHRGHFLGPAVTEVTGSGLVSLRSLARLRPAPAGVPVSGLLPQRSLTWVWSCRGCWPGPSPAEVTGSGPILWKSLAQASSLRDLWVRTAPLEVDPSYLLLQRSLTWACSCGGSWLRPAPMEVTGLEINLI